MDNISKVPLLHRLITLGKCASIGVPVLVDILGLVSFFADGLREWINSQLGGVGITVVLLIINLVFIANIFVIVGKISEERANKATYFVRGYKDILRRYADRFSEFDEKCSELNSVEELYFQVSSVLKGFVDDTSKVLSKVCGNTVRACVKAFPEKYAHCDIFKMELMTFCRSDKDLSESVDERKVRVPVDKNTDFKSIMVKTFPYFAFNDLRNYENETKTKYENSTENWEKKYLATIVFPISKSKYVSRGKEMIDVLGFLCVDTLSTKAFSAEIGPMCIAFVESLSSLLYVVLDRCIKCRERIEAQVFQS